MQGGIVALADLASAVRNRNRADAAVRSAKQAVVASPQPQSQSDPKPQRKARRGARSVHPGEPARAQRPLVCKDAKEERVKATNPAAIAKPRAAKDEARVSEPASAVPVGARKRQLRPVESEVLMTICATACGMQLPSAAELADAERFRRRIRKLRRFIAWEDIPLSFFIDEIVADVDLDSSSDDDSDSDSEMDKAVDKENACDNLGAAATTAERILEKTAPSKALPVRAKILCYARSARHTEQAPAQQTQQAQQTQETRKAQKSQGDATSRSRRGCRAEAKGRRVRAAIAAPSNTCFGALETLFGPLLGPLLGY